MKKFFKSTYFAIILLIIYIPIIVMIFFSFNSGSTVFSWVSFSGEWYAEFFRNSPFLKSILTSLFVAVVSTLISLLIGVSAAIGLGRTKKVTQKSWFTIANIPLINADVVTAVSLMVVFLLLGLQFGIGTLLLAHISFNVPFVLITVMPRLRKIDPALLESASDLGAKYYQILFKVILPVLKPAIITAAVIAFSMSFDDFIISYFTGGDQTNVSTFIYTAKRVRPYIFAFGTILVGAIIVAVIIWNAVQIVKTKRNQTIEEVKAGWYKAKEMNKYYKELGNLYSELNNRTRIYVSKNPGKWIRYWWFTTLVKLYSLRNFDHKISKLEWKQYKIKNEIRNERRYYTSLKNTNKAILKIEKEIEKKSADIRNLKRVAKLHLRLEKLIDKQDFLESEIEWIENRNERQADKIEKINRRLKVLEKDYKLQLNTLSKNDINWYNKKIKDLTAYKIELEEGKNHYKLRIVVEKLREMRDLRNNKIYELESKVKNAYQQVYIVKPITSFYRPWTIHKGENYLVGAETYLGKELNHLEVKILKVEEQIVKLETKIEKKKDKLFPQDENDEVHSKGFFARSWKVIVIVAIGLAAFSGLTVAYVKNNIYDLTIGNWGEYIDPDLIQEFEQQTGYRVNYQVYDSNETLYNKLYTFTYDVMVPSDYMIQQLVSENKLRKIDYDKLEELQTKDENEISWKAPDAYTNYLKNGPYKTDSVFYEYSVPYFWGDVGVLLNVNNPSVKNLLTDNDLVVDETTHTVANLSWEIIKKAVDRGMNVTLNNDPKNLFLIANEIINKKANATSFEEVDQAYEYLKGLVRSNNVSLQGDDMLAAVINGAFDVAVMYSGDAVQSTLAYLENHDKPFAFARPSEGTNIYFDSIVVSNRSGHEAAAYRFINFIRDHAIQNTEYVGLASPYQEVMEELATTTFAELGAWYRPSENGESYVFNKEVDPYLVEKYNNLLASK